LSYIIFLFNLSITKIELKARTKKTNNEIIKNIVITKKTPNKTKTLVIIFIGFIVEA